jgi:hypothetical protein
MSITRQASYRPEGPGETQGKLVSFSDAMPTASEAERTLLGTIFTDAINDRPDAPNLRAALAEGIGPRHFQSSPHRRIFEAMRSLLIEKLPVDVVGVWQFIAADQGSLDAELRQCVLDLSRDGVSSLHLRSAIDQLKKCEASRLLARAALELIEGINANDNERQAEARRQIASAGQEHLGGLPRICSAAELVTRDCPAPPVLISGLLHRGAKLLLGGGSKTYKTWCLLDLAISVASGTEFWGLPTTPGRVLFLNFEIQEPFFRMRIIAIAKGKDLEPTTFGPNLDIWTLRGHATDLSKLTPQIIAQAAGRDYSLIIIDPVYKCLGERDENAAGEIAGLLNEVEALAVKTGAAVAIAHHFAKGNASGKDSKDRVSGSGVWARDPDSIVTITPHEAEGAFTIDCTLRNFAPRPSFCVRWDWPLMRADNDLDPAALKQLGRPAGHTTANLLETLPVSGATYTEWRTLALQSGMSESTFKRLTKALREAGSVTSLQGRYCRTGKGGLA